ncbi:hypothetical protein [Halobaculum litoreum]|uniref:hypothetical protein n=1 Tax=Halobaculum litoreum TaxID=3031998 RepID=UPI0024C280A8|nr:hypothetical protein [Halobaculum sp. DT92]
MFDFETRFWIVVTPALASILVGLVAGGVRDRPALIVAGVAVAVAWAAVAYGACTYFDYGVGDVPEYDPEARR